MTIKYSVINLGSTKVNINKILSNLSNSLISPIQRVASIHILLTNNQYQPKGSHL